jgi:hypothetical protein
MPAQAKPTQLQNADAAAEMHISPGIFSICSNFYF